MAEGKKSFVLYADLIKNIDHLTNEEKGILFKHLLEYVNDMNPVLEDRVILSAWKFIQSQLKRDLQKFEEIKVKRSDAGKESARLRALKKEQQKEINSTNSTSVKSVQQSSTNPTVNVNDNVNDNVTTIKEVVLKFAEEIKTGLHGEWKDNIYMKFGLKDNSLGKLFEEFEQHLIITDAKHKKIDELKKHFYYWIGTQETNKKLDKYKK